MSRFNSRSARSDKRSHNDSNNEMVEEGLATRNSSPAINEEGGNNSSEVINSSSEQVWNLINQRLAELEATTQRILADDRRQQEIRDAQREKEASLKIAALESSMSRALETTANLTQGLEAREARFQAQLQRLETAQVRVAERITDSPGNRTNDPTMVDWPNIKYILPEFNGQGSPMRYLRQLQQYWKVVRPRACDAEYLIERSLSGPPGDWWLIVKNEITDIDKFIIRFQQRYWNDQVQHEVKKRLEFGYFQPLRDRSRAEYATKLFAQAGELIPPMDPRETIKKLARHFTDEIRYAVVGRGIHNCEKLIELLEEFDKIGNSNNKNTELYEQKQKTHPSRESHTQNTQAWKPRSSEERENNYTQRWTPQQNPRYGNQGANMATQKYTSPGGQRSQNDREQWRQQSSRQQYQVQNLETEMQPIQDEDEHHIHETPVNNQGN